MYPHPAPPLPSTHRKGGVTALRRLALALVAGAMPAAAAAEAIASAEAGEGAAPAADPRKDERAATEPTASPAPKDAPPPERKAVWALGVGGTVFVAPDYVGSDRNRVRALPIPYVEYESPRFTVDRTGASGALLRWRRVRAEISGSGSLPVDSSDNKERRGMPDLDPVLELGPALKVELWRSEDAADAVHFELPVRSALALSFEGIEPVGWTFTPNLEWRRREPLEEGHWTARLSMGPQFNDGEYNNYYYGVKQKDARDNRPAYTADGGYGGFRVACGLGWRRGDLWVGSFLRYIYLRDAVFDDSPLVRTDHALFTGLAAAWVFASSDANTAAAHRDEQQ